MWIVSIAVGTQRQSDARQQSQNKIPLPGKIHGESFDGL